MMNAIYPYWMKCRMMRPDDGAGIGGADQPQEQQQTASERLDAILKNDPALQSEYDRRQTKGLQTARGKWEQEAAEKMEAEKSEAAKMARMTAEQKAEHERQKQAEVAEKREQELAKREQAIALREMRAEAAATLTEKGIPVVLLDALDYSDAENCTASIEKVEKAFRTAVQQGVEERLKGNGQPMKQQDKPADGGKSRVALMEEQHHARMYGVRK